MGINFTFIMNVWGLYCLTMPESISSFAFLAPHTNLESSSDKEDDPMSSVSQVEIAALKALVKLSELEKTLKYLFTAS